MNNNAKSYFKEIKGYCQEMAKDPNYGMPTDDEIIEFALEMYRNEMRAECKIVKTHLHFIND